MERRIPLKYHVIFNQLYFEFVLFKQQGSLYKNNNRVVINRHIHIEMSYQWKINRCGVDKVWKKKNDKPFDLCQRVW